MAVQHPEGDRQTISSTPGIVGRALILIVCGAFLLRPNVAAAQSTVPSRIGIVTNAAGEPIRAAQILDEKGRLLTTSAQNGKFCVPADVSQIEVVAPHYAPASFELPVNGPLQIRLERPLDTVVVTAYRSPLATSDSAASTRVLTRKDLKDAVPLGLDGKLRTVPGFELFRRSSSLVANPTTEGVSLRGLGSTAASRSLVIFDGIPMNDPYGGWIHWEELPDAVIQSIEIVRGGESDLYGSSAIGGVISIFPVIPSTDRLEIETSGGSEGTVSDSIFASAAAGKWSGMFGGSLIATDGYTLIAPQFRGSIDQPSNVHAQNALLEADRKIWGTGRAFLRASVLNEDRHNGTPYQANGTKLWRYVAGADTNYLQLRLYGTSEHYRQSFSSINAARDAETPTRFEHDPASEFGAEASWRQAVRHSLLLLAGVDTHDIRATNDQVILTQGNEIQITGSHQRLTGGFGEALYTPGKWIVSGSARVDRFTNFDARQMQIPGGSASLPTLGETVFNPRVGITHRLRDWLAVSASAFRAYRSPTENELYRTGQVGQQITLPNPSLRSERATGWESGAQFDVRQVGATVRASYFFTIVNRPITALTLSTTPTAETLQRANLGQIESRGVSLDYALQERWIAITGGYQFAKATVTEFQQEPVLVGKWIPQVARNMATTQVELNRERWGLLSLQGRLSGKQYDDDLNQYLLHGYFRLDAYASRRIGRHVEAYAEGENLFDRAIEVGKTPLLTLGTPRTVRVGLRWNIGRTNQ